MVHSMPQSKHPKHAAVSIIPYYILTHSKGGGVVALETMGAPKRTVTDQCMLIPQDVLFCSYQQQRDVCLHWVPAKKPCVAIVVLSTVHVFC